MENTEHENASKSHIILQQLLKRCTDALHVIDRQLNDSSKDTEQCDSIELDEADENASYLDMSVRKYESYDMTKAKENLHPNEYVDVVGKLSNRDNYDDDDNVYDDFMVEQSKLTSRAKCGSPAMHVMNHSGKVLSTKRDCPFNGLPAAHLTIMQSPKVGWLMMHLRRKRFLPRFGIHLKRKYYAGLIAEKTDGEKNSGNWWLLMYSNATDLKPTICLQVDQFDVIRIDATTDKDDSSKGRKSRISRIAGHNQKVHCKFELKEKVSATKRDPATYCLVAEAIDQREQWYTLLRQFVNGQHYVETMANTAQIRKLPMLPTTTSSAAESHDMNTKDAKRTLSASKNSALYSNEPDLCNYSEGVYEEPEDFYKNIAETNRSTPKSDKPNLPRKKSLQFVSPVVLNDEISLIYDTPKTPVRATLQSTDQVDHFKEKERDEYALMGPKQSGEETNRTGDADIDEFRRSKINEFRSKLTTQLKEAPQKLYLPTSRSSEDNCKENGNGKYLGNAKSTSSTNANNNKYQLSNVRKWLFTNHLAKIRQSSAASDSVDQQNRRSQLVNANTSRVDQQKRVFSVQPKGTKVHMIINQLEANGQLTLISGGATSNKSNSFLMTT